MISRDSGTPPRTSAITDAAAWLDRQLARNPLALGEPRAPSIHRVATSGPLGIEFEVIADDNLARAHGAFVAG